MKFTAQTTPMKSGKNKRINDAHSIGNNNNGHHKDAINVLKENL